MLTKRIKITITVIVLSVALFFLPSVNVTWRLYTLFGIIILSYLLSVWALLTPKSIYQSLMLRGKELSYDLAGIEFLTLFSLPMLLTSTFGIYFFQFVPSMMVLVLSTLSYGAALYVILLVENIFNVAAERGIPLLRAAHTVGYLATLFVTFVLFSLLWGLGLDGWLLSLITLFISGLIFFQAFWQIDLEEHFNQNLAVYSVISALITTETAWMLSFWPLRPLTFGLSTAAVVYVILGVIQHRMQNKLNKRTLFEYLTVLLVVFVLLLAITSWGA